MKTALLSIFIGVSLFLTSCGYRVGRGALTDCYSTICIPYVEGDRYGCLTAALIRAITRKGNLIYDRCSPDLILKVCLLEPEDDMIGYEFAIENDQRADFIVSNEARLILTARITVCDRITGNTLIGPFEVRSFLDYDFEPDLSNVDDQAFSLGQLVMHNEAQDAAFMPAYVLLAEKIADYLYNGW